VVVVVAVQSALNVASVVILQGNVPMEMDIGEVEVIDMEAEAIVMEVVVVGVVNMVLIAMAIGMEDVVGMEGAVVVKTIAITVTVLVHMTVQVVAGHVLMMIVIEECGCFGGCEASVKKF